MRVLSSTLLTIVLVGACGRSDLLQAASHMDGSSGGFAGAGGVAGWPGTGGTLPPDGPTPADAATGTDVRPADVTAPVEADSGEVIREDAPEADAAATDTMAVSICQHGGAYVPLAADSFTCDCPGGTWGARCAQTTVSVSAGYHHTCGVKSDGTVACWGITVRPPQD
jgi:hypothetical protein